MAGIFIRRIPRLCNSLVCRNHLKQPPNRVCSSETPLFTDHTEPPIPPYKERSGEDEECMRARLLYQSRKRGMLENGLLLSTFAGLHLKDFTLPQLKMYDRLINRPTNDWEIYYWMTGVKPTPDEYNNEVMDMLKKHVCNEDKASRITQPDLN
ncbi:succinate dehydrogenase assembly factor 2, mitochondrial-like [Pomacea canaliculata]|uniref:succinate dehydrogenase assembly factor 2, mitochondrial-like n=1 Tax=Pomacea canaliculata TaxID=400727 RepID=UPI000D7337BA|nr:succinate dehydrogenase assembly factor 2, mitochondrial-like [Pomacea canaliculata]